MSIHQDRISLISRLSRDLPTGSGSGRIIKVKIHGQFQRSICMLGIVYIQCVFHCISERTASIIPAFFHININLSDTAVLHNKYWIISNLCLFIGDFIAVVLQVHTPVSSVVIGNI